MELQDAGDLRARVAEGVVDPPRLEDERTGRGKHQLAADVERQLALQDEGALVLAGVGVGRDHVAGAYAPLDARERAAEVLRRHLMGYAQDGQEGTLVRTDEDLPLVLLRCHRLPSFHPAYLADKPAR